MEPPPYHIPNHKSFPKFEGMRMYITMVLVMSAIVYYIGLLVFCIYAIA